MEKSGNKKREIKKKKAVDREVNPVRPPSATPLADSTKVVMVDVPKRAPQTVPMASDKRALLTPGRFPSLSIKSALVATPVRVPTVSKISTKRKVNMTENMSKVRMLFHSRWKATSLMDGGRENKLAIPGKWVTPVIRAITVEIIIPYNKAPRTCLAVKIAMVNRATMAIKLSLVKRLPIDR